MRIGLEFLESTDQSPDICVFHTASGKQSLGFLSSEVRKNYRYLYEKWIELMRDIAIEVCKKYRVDVQMHIDPSMFGKPLEGNN